MVFYWPVLFQLLGLANTADERNLALADTSMSLLEIIQHHKLIYFVDISRPIILKI